jgi:iron complex outermembrane receptor protein
MIQGKVAGLQITNGGGSPGEGATIRIRMVFTFSK